MLMFKDLSAHIEDLKTDGAVKFTAEYESIEPGQQFTWDNSSMDVNKPKNRSAGHSQTSTNQRTGQQVTLRHH